VAVNPGVYVFEAHVKPSAELESAKSTGSDLAP